MRRTASILLAILALVSCGETPNPPLPARECVESQMGVRYSYCVRYEMKCPAPLQLHQEDDKSPLICRLRK